MPKRLFTDDQERAIADAYQTRSPDGTWRGATQIAREWGTNHRTIYCVLKRQGVTTRDARESHAHGKRCKPIKNIPTTPAPLCACGCGEPAKWHPRKNIWGKFADGHRTPPQPFKNREWLYTEYVTKNRSTPEIARDFNVIGGTIARWLKRLDIPRRDVSESKRGRFGGHKNPAWRGGVTPVRQRLYKRDEWRKLVAETLKRDNYTCARCGVYRAKAEPKLVTHHIRAFATHPSLRFDPANLVTLCEKCHRWVHSKANKARRFIVD